MFLENALSDGVRFLDMDALSSAVGMKIDFDMALLVVYGVLKAGFSIQNHGGQWKSARSPKDDPLA